jgi:hypothetical protein
MFRVFFVNHNYFSASKGETLEEAREIARKAGFEAAVYNRYNEVVASYSPISGFYVYRKAA